MNERITREQKIMQSVIDHVRAALFVERGYPEDQIDLLDGFPHEQIQNGAEIEKTAIAVGFNFDDQGTSLELGSSLKRRIYTIEFFVFGTTPVWAENLAGAVKFELDRDGTIPLKDVALEGAPEIDRMEVLGVSAERHPVPRPRPWERNVWIVTLKVADDYFAAVV